TVGPDSAGADPGPACYQRGGSLPAVTDANLQLGRIDSAGFASGEIDLDPNRATVALTRDVGTPLGIETRRAAAGMIEIVDENMANAARVHAIERGRVIGRHSMIAFGGSAPLHATRLAEKLGMSKVIVPAGAGVGSAIGFLRAPLAYEVVRSRRMTIAEFDADAANDLLSEMTDAAAAVIEPGLGGDLTKALPSRSVVVDMRYIGQGHELTIGLPDTPLEQANGAQLATDFEATYQEIYGVRLDHVGIEITAWSLTVAATASTAAPYAEPIISTNKGTTAKPSGTRDVCEPTTGRTKTYDLYRRVDLQPGDFLKGPAIIIEDQTSTVVPSGWRAHLASTLAIVLESGVSDEEDMS
ncbi:MAG: hydantoinase/oxoprolinase family protein, partial [Geminicoccaceae bacterium]